MPQRALSALNIKVFAGIVNRNRLPCAGRGIVGKSVAHCPKTLLKNWHFAVFV